MINVEIQPRLIAARFSPSEFDDEIIQIEENSVLAPNFGLNSRFN